MTDHMYIKALNPQQAHAEEARNWRNYTVRPLYARPVPAIPAGWKPVPVEPTPEMIRAGEIAWVQKERDMCSPTPTEFDEGGPAEACYFSMLAAAPEVTK